MTEIRDGQLAGIAVATGDPQLQVRQFFGIAVATEVPPEIRIGQLAMIAVISGNTNYVSLGQPIKLPCWQPCTAFGTRSIVVNR